MAITEIVKNHHASLDWDRVMEHVRTEMVQRKLHPAQTVVLVPYAQLMQEARTAWSRVVPATGPGGQAAFMPRFETTMNWTRSLGGFEPAAHDLQLDAARDLLTAAHLLEQSGLPPRQSALAARLMEQAWSLARLAAAVAPDRRAAWGEQLAGLLTEGMAAPALALEARIGRIALAWATHSSYPTDSVFTARPGLLMVLQGFQAEPLQSVLLELWADRAVLLPLDRSGQSAAASPQHTTLGSESTDTSPGFMPPYSPLISLHATEDGSDEAQRATACVLGHLAAGRAPVALVAQDRVLTRQIRALLAGRGVALRDETGWKLSTTRAAASLMALLKACAWDASTDIVLDWLKAAPAFAAVDVDRLEATLRKLGLREWRQVLRAAQARNTGAAEKTQSPDLAAAGAAISKLSPDVVASVQTPLGQLQAARPLARWLQDLRSALASTGQWPGLATDAAGQAVLDALSLHEGEQSQFDDVTQRMSLSDFSGWVSQTLEAASFFPAHPPAEQVVILPLSQLLGRPLAAVVFPGCDEQRLPASPQPSDHWTPAQRQAFGLPSRDALALSQRAAWLYALKTPHVDLLWRTSDGGERLMPSILVQELMLKQRAGVPPGMDAIIEPHPTDARVLREVSPATSGMPQPDGSALHVSSLSASAYEQLRTCPYRFFALRQLRLAEDDELDVELGKRDFGTWLHSVLRHFHEALKVAPAPDHHVRVAMLNIASEKATQELGLSSAEFLPFAATWPQVREGYLEWLAKHESGGVTFDRAEEKLDMPLGTVTLNGRIDRIDQLPDGSKLVIDYKTEASAKTAQRIKTPLEDTQLAFYAALLGDDTLGAAYVNVGEKDGTRAYMQDDIVDLRDQLVEGLMDDMARIAAGAPLPALGEGMSCEYCAARGLCRKDFWVAA